MPAGRDGRLHATLTEGMSDLSNRYPVTPDGRYLVVRGRLWRCTNPVLTEAERARLTSALMKARRAVGVARTHGNPGALAKAGLAVNEAKIDLGERGPVWWKDGAPDFNRHMARTTPYADWYRSVDDGGH